MEICSPRQTRSVCVGLGMGLLQLATTKSGEGQSLLRHSPDVAELDVNSQAVQRTFSAMVARGVAMTSTLAYFETFSPDRPPLDQRVLDAMSPVVKADYLASRARIAKGSAPLGIGPELLHTAMAYERAFVLAGGLLGAGVDPTGNGGALPGFGDSTEL